MLKIKYIKSKAQELKKKLIMLYLATKHPASPWYTKWFILLILAYALSPIDLIPDVVPVIGLLDDLLLLPFGIWLALKMIPKHVKKECAEEARNYNWKKKKNFIFAIFTILLWMIVVILLLLRYLR